MLWADGMEGFFFAVVCESCLCFRGLELPVKKDIAGRLYLKNQGSISPTI